MGDEFDQLMVVPFLPTALTSLVIKDWTGSTKEYQRNAEVFKVMTGRGKASFKDGHLYDGDIKNGMLNGKGVFTWTDGTVFKGKFKNNEITGEGRYDWPDGTYYSGHLKVGIRNGTGKYVNPNEGFQYDGEWRNGVRHGKGKLSYNNGALYEGEWLEGRKCGHGKFTYKTGNTYEGQWFNNARHGHGIMHWKTSSEKYEGQWENDLQCGFGTHIWLDKKGENKQLRNRYVGNWKDGKRHGNGTFYYANGSKYVGDWEHNLKHGEGVFTFEDGNTYMGEFERDRMVNRTLPGVTITAGIQNQDKAQLAIEEANAAAKPTASAKSGMAKTNAKDNKESTMGKPKVSGTKRAKLEVEANPYKGLLEINDIIMLEHKPTEILKEIQNIMLRRHSQLKRWYKFYSQKVERVKTEESFSMTMRQFWRFLRDCQVTSYKVPLAQINRIFLQGSKIKYSLHAAAKMNIEIGIGKGWRPESKSTDPQASFEKVTEKSEIGIHKTSTPGVGQIPDGNMSTNNPQRDNISPDLDHSMLTNIENEPSFTSEKDMGKRKTRIDYDTYLSEEDEAFSDLLAEDAEDIHSPERVVLQRHFLEGVVRAAYVAYANSTELSTATLATKLDYLFKNKLMPNATKNLLRKREEEMFYKQGEHTLRKGLDKKLATMFANYSIKRKSKMYGSFDSTITVETLFRILKSVNIFKPEFTELHLVDIIEDTHSPEVRITSAEKQNPEKLFNHLQMLKGAELIYFEFKEIIMDLSVALYKEKKPDEALKMLCHLLLHKKSPPKLRVITADRFWPKTEKDIQVEKMLEEKMKREEEERKLEEERKQQFLELELMREEDKKDKKEEEEKKRPGTGEEDEDGEEEEEEGLEGEEEGVDESEAFNPSDYSDDEDDPSI